MSNSLHYPTALLGEPLLPVLRARPGSTVAELRDECGDDVVRTFEQGGMVLVDDFPLQYDSDFLARINLAAGQEHRVKKAKGKSLLAPLVPETYETHVLSCFFPGNILQATYFQQQVRWVSAQLAQLVETLFPGYRVLDSQAYSWRFSLTIDEELHYDSYGQNDDEHVRLRVFYNLDERPRLWAVAGAVDQTLRAWSGRVRREPRLRDMAPNQVNNWINTGLPCAEIPRSYVAFAPRTLWIVDSQKIGHQILYGRRLLAYTYTIDYASVRFPEARFQEVVRRTLQEINHAAP